MGDSSVRQNATLGAYRLISKLGVGGMGEVWLAEHERLGRRAAIKVLHDKLNDEEDTVTRFFNEARAATAIGDPGIVQIYDFGHAEDGSAYLAMELLEGEALDRRLHRLGRLQLDEALRLTRQVASTLGVAHQRGIIHRDLKPENIFLVKDPEVPGGERPKLLDFGIAKLVGEASLVTDTQVVMGTPAFMSPEQCRGAGRVDQRADVYSMGCVLFSLITGGLPFEAAGAGELIAMQLREPPPAPSSRVPGISPALDALVLRCLAKAPEHRFASGVELAAAIDRLLAAPDEVTMKIAPRVVREAQARARAPELTTLARRASSSTVKARPALSPWTWASALALLLIGGGVATALLVGRTAAGGVGGEAEGDAGIAALVAAAGASDEEATPVRREAQERRDAEEGAAGEGDAEGRDAEEGDANEGDAGARDAKSAAPDGTASDPTAAANDPTAAANDPAAPQRGDERATSRDAPSRRARTVGSRRLAPVRQTFELDPELRAAGREAHLGGPLVDLRSDPWTDHAGTPPPARTAAEEEAARAAAKAPFSAGDPRCKNAGNTHATILASRDGDRRRGVRLLELALRNPCFADRRAELLRFGVKLACDAHLPDKVRLLFAQGGATPELRALCPRLLPAPAPAR